ncbi:carboxyltransferase domain-containing protein [Pseudomonas aeruginosa]|nr:carboxyltransferase domain-containing protein [Pseudomonas aeruginosa]
MSQPQPRIEVAAIDSFVLRLFERIDEANMPWLLAAEENLRAAFGAALLDLVPSYTTLLLQYDLLQLDPGEARARIRRGAVRLEPETPGRRPPARPADLVRPARVGPDLEPLARRKQLGVAELIRRHSQHEYRVFALGFSPGFAFMGLVEEALAAPRLATPRQRIAAGSVGIAERQTAVYPQASPGGWNLLGRCPVRLFDLTLDGYSLLRAGDRVRFEPIGHAEFVRLGGDDTPLEVQA